VKSELENAKDRISWQLVRFFGVIRDVIETGFDIHMPGDHLEVDTLIKLYVKV
jgi:hypothetical protein